LATVLVFRTAVAGAQAVEPEASAVVEPIAFDADLTCADPDPTFTSEGSEEEIAPGLTLMRLPTPTWSMTVGSASDARLAGDATFALSGDLYWDGPSVAEAASPSLADVFVGTLRIATADGAWEGTTYAFALANEQQVPADAVVLTGSGAYEGLVALTVMEQGASLCEWALHGVILAGGLPPAPVLPSD
jgi:hypothetical protein